MSYRYNKQLDMLVGYDALTGALSHGWVDYQLDEIELGARVALAINDPEQWFWEIHHEEIEWMLIHSDH